MGLARRRTSDNYQYVPVHDAPITTEDIANDVKTEAWKQKRRQADLQELFKRAHREEKSRKYH